MGRFSLIARYRRCSQGATAIEYALIAGLVAVVAIPALIWVRDFQHRISDELDAATGRASVRDDNREPARKPVKAAHVRDDIRAPVQAD